MIEDFGSHIFCSDAARLSPLDRAALLAPGLLQLIRP
jgi:hypothetical protein